MHTKNYGAVAILSRVFELAEVFCQLAYVSFKFQIDQHASSVFLGCTELHMQQKFARLHNPAFAENAISDTDKPKQRKQIYANKYEMFSLLL